MKRAIGYLILSAAFLVSGTAFAEQGCPDGFMPNPSWTQGQQQCIQGQMPDSGPLVPQSTWERRWGAFTSDVETGKIGVATAMTTKRKAEKEALRDCQARGGAQCKVLLAFTNQCAAIAWGKESTGTAAISAVGGVNSAVAKSAALQECGKRAGSCEIFLTECSFAEQVQ
ncbi:DUF4189 domain-containing protein [Lysobacter enzymogenes]|nr:DUF4189 domain-containing protein [Lysobacter enzymogenes]QCW26612.1 DUF4189 domain-containing protein [Lysobacter enzymogenes]